MKKIFIFIFLIFSCSLFAQTGTGWQPIRYKPNFLDSANFARQFKLSGTTVRSNAQELNILDSALVAAYELNRLVGILAPVQTQLNAKLDILDTVNMLSKYLLKADSTLQPTGYFTKTRGNIVEADLNNTYTVPAATTGDVMTWDGTGWIPAAPASNGGGGSATSKLQFVVGITSGAPGAGDSIITHTNFVEKHVEVYRGVNATQGGGLKQHRNPTGSLQNTTKGYRFNKQTGTIILKPVLATNDNIIVEVTDSTTWTDIVLPAGVSSLLTGIKTYYRMEQTSGTSLTDTTGNKNLTTDAISLRVAGIIGRAMHMGWQKELSGFPYNAATTLNWSTWTVKLWVKLDSLPTATGRPYTLFSTLHSAAPYWNAILRVETDNRLRIRVRNDASAVIESYGDTLQTVNHWYHIVVKFRGNGYATQIFKAGAESTEAGAGIFSGTLYQVNRGEYWGCASDDDGSTWTSGAIDECGTWGRDWSNGEILQNYNDEKGGKTYPWTP